MMAGFFAPPFSVTIQISYFLFRLLCLKHTVAFRDGIRHVVVQVKVRNKPPSNECKSVQSLHKYQKQVCMCVWSRAG